MVTEIDDVGRGLARFKAKDAAGVETARPIDWGDHDCLYFLDPDGNLLEVVSYR
jgi:catechol 2,3-dioxygenase-like lactoylglutathione lyase family enzyme